MVSHSCHVIPLYGIAWYCIVGFGARAVSRKTPIYFIEMKGGQIINERVTTDVRRLVDTVGAA